MMAVLRKGNIDSYSFTPKDLKRTSLVLRGLYHRTELEDIKADLEKHMPNTVEKVSRFRTEYSKKNNIDTGLFLVTLYPGKSIRDLRAIRIILSEGISWENPKVNLKMPQCWRCQQWGHMSKNCNRPYVCVKCDAEHLPGKCTFVSSEVNPPYCANCGERGHPSSYRGCKVYIEFLKNNRKLKEQALYRKQQASSKVLDIVKSSGYTIPGQSFASLFQNSPEPGRKSEKPPIIVEFLKIANIICNSQTLEERIETFVKSYKTLSKDEAVAQCLKLINEVKEKYEP